MNCMKERIERIEKMEALLNQLLEANKQADKALTQLENSRDAMQTLLDYYSSPLWKADYSADERGEIPSHIRRGVLSEDGVYNMLWEYRNLQDRMAALLKPDDA